MQEVVDTSGTQEPVLDSLVGSDCTFCDIGTLVRETYKGNNAAICTQCGVPGAQHWNGE